MNIKCLMKFNKLNTELQEAATNAQFYSTIMFPILGNISYVNYAITAAVGGYSVIINWMDIGGTCLIPTILKNIRTTTCSNVSTNERTT